ncbi:MAG: serine/threonine protein kinase [Gemmatimonadota bacterium]|nr:serine/threonine protein kinase [Gemmatimonadota bacterium]
MTAGQYVAAVSTPADRDVAPGPISMPMDLLEQSCKRVAVLGLVFAGLWASGLVMANLTGRFLMDGLPLHGHAWPMPGNLVAGIGLAMSLGLTALAVKLQDRPNLLLDLSLGFEVATAFLLGVMAQWTPEITPARLTWIPVVILVFPAIAPNTPTKILVAGLLAATMDPVGVLIAKVRGVTIDASPLALAVSFFGNYVCAFIAVIPVHIIRRLGRQARRARDLGSYKLGDEIGRGGMGEVYRAEHKLLARQAAIKLIRPEMLGARDPDAARVMVTRFKREAQAAAALRSPHTIELYDFGTSQDGAFYYVMELLDGVDLDTLVQRFGPVPPDRVAHLMKQACLSLAEAHGQGLVHRDIKPSNLLTTRMGVEVDFIKVLDFGLVKARHGRADTLLTQPHVATGTPAYMAPEVAMGETDIDERADLYSLGCVMYWLLTGQLVFERDNPLVMMHAHVSEPPVPPSQRTEITIPAELEALVLTCLAKKRDGRPRNALELGRALSSVPGAGAWSADRAQQWWDTHLPTRAGAEPCDRGELAPHISSE